MNSVVTSDNANNSAPRLQGHTYRQVTYWHPRFSSVTIIILDNAELYSTKTRNSHNLHLPLPQSTKYQKGVHYAGVWLFNHLPAYIKKLANESRVFKKTLKKFLMDNSFYFVDEFINFRE